MIEDDVARFQTTKIQIEETRASKVASLMRWLCNITPERIAAVYGIEKQAGAETYGIQQGYVNEKYRDACKNPASWFLDLDLGNRVRCLRVAIGIVPDEAVERMMDIDALRTLVEPRREEE